MSQLNDLQKEKQSREEAEGIVEKLEERVGEFGKRKQRYLRKISRRRKD